MEAKISRKLPSVLSINEIEKILLQPNIENNLGIRDKAMLELLYSSGLRVSEMINLKVSDLFFEDEVIRVLGKGSKQRIVPIGSSAVNWLTKYLKIVRPLLQKRMFLKPTNYKLVIHLMNPDKLVFLELENFQKA